MNWWQFFSANPVYSAFLLLGAAVLADRLVWYGLAFVCGCVMGKREGSVP